MGNEFIDLYCERIGPAFWAEPLNAVTNLAFIVVALLLVRDIPREQEILARDPVLWTLIALVFFIGIGSGLFHTLAVFWAMWADIIPITLFILVYIYFAFRRFFGLGVWFCLTCVVLVLAATGALPVLTGSRGSSYIPALAVMLGAGLLLRIQGNRKTGNALLLAGGVFAASLGFRTVDEPLCEIIPIGTHFLWHILNAAVLYVLSNAMLKFVESHATFRRQS